ncbi:MAG: terminase small subunit [Janthinobacterium lividum]
MPLNLKQKRFCEEYIIDLNATQAAIRAGYSENTAYSQGQRLLKDVEIQVYIQSLMNKRAERVEITADYVLNTVVETIERCRQVAPVIDRKGEQVYVENKDGKVVPAFTFDAKNVLKGAELLGKHLRLFNEKAPDEDPDKPVQPVSVIVNVVDASKKPDADA